MTFNNEQRALLARLADVLIPASDGHRSASQADVAGQWLDCVLAARPDLAAGLVDVLQKSHDIGPADAVAALKSSDPAAFGVLTEIAAAAYFIAMPLASGTNEMALAPRLLVLVARSARKFPSASSASSASEVKSRP